MKKNILIYALTLSALGLWWKTSSPKPELPIVGVIQIIEHPALDQTRRGILDELESNGFKDGQKIAWHYESAQGNPALATQIAQKYIGQKASVLVTIGTTVSQAALQAIKQSGSATPLVFASVTNPIAAKLVGSDNAPEKGVTGVSNYVEAKKQFGYFKKLLPNMTRLGVVYNPGETNSVSLNAEMIKAGKDVGIEIVFATASRTSDVSTATQSLLAKVDAIFINNDNTALASFDSVVATASLQNIPVLVSDLDCLAKGALAALGADQYALGRQVGKQVANILRKPESASSTTMQYPLVVEGKWNQKIAHELKIVLPNSG